MWNWRNSNFRPTATCLEHCSIVLDPEEETLRMRCPSWETRAPYVTCLLYTICCNIVCLTSFPFSDCCAFTGINKSHISCNKWRRVRFHKSRTWQNEIHDDDNDAQSYSRIFSHSNSIIIFARNDEKWFGTVRARSNRNRMEKKIDRKISIGDANRVKWGSNSCESDKWQFELHLKIVPSVVYLSRSSTALHFPTMSSRWTNSAHHLSQNVFFSIQLLSTSNFSLNFMGFCFSWAHV